MFENRIYHALGLTAMIIAMLLLLSLFSESFSVGGISIRKMDILADVRPETGRNESNSLPSSVGSRDSCPPGIICLDNFSDFDLTSIHKKLDSLRPQKKTFRIAFFGDSFTEGDVFVGDLRDSLQTRYGGEGVGFMAITSEAAVFRQSVQHSFSGNWKKKTIVGAGKRHDNFGISGAFFNSEKSSKVTYRGSDVYKHTGKFSRARFFFAGTKNLDIGYSINDGDFKNKKLSGIESVNEFVVSADSIRSLSYYVGSGTDVFGVSLEDTIGVIVDNFALRGILGMELLRIPEENLQGFQNLLNYDLIIIQYGTNLTTSKLSDFTYYEDEMNKVIAHLKSAFGKKPILLISAADRSRRKGGKFITMENVPVIVGSQLNIARKNGLIFWNLFEAMGGENSMHEWVTHRPKWAQKDHTHVSFDGGRELSHRFMLALNFEKLKMEKRSGLYP